MPELPDDMDDHRILTTEEQLHKLTQNEQQASLQLMMLEVQWLQAISLYNDPATYEAANDAIAFLFHKQIAIEGERSVALDEIPAVTA
jgi:hypothetical protein